MDDILVVPIETESISIALLLVNIRSLFFRLTSTFITSLDGKLWVYSNYVPVGSINVALLVLYTIKYFPRQVNALKLSVSEIVWMVGVSELLISKDGVDPKL